jgi:hypothetical protein
MKINTIGYLMLIMSFILITGCPSGGGGNPDVTVISDSSADNEISSDILKDAADSGTDLSIPDMPSDSESIQPQDTIPDQSQDVVPDTNELVQNDISDTYDQKEVIEEKFMIVSTTPKDQAINVQPQDGKYIVEATFNKPVNIYSLYSYGVFIFARDANNVLKYLNLPGGNENENALELSKDGKKLTFKIPANLLPQNSAGMTFGFTSLLNSTSGSPLVPEVLTFSFTGSLPDGSIYGQAADDPLSLFDDNFPGGVAIYGTGGDSIFGFGVIQPDGSYSIDNIPDTSTTGGGLFAIMDSNGDHLMEQLSGDSYYNGFMENIKVAASAKVKINFNFTDPRACHGAAIYNGDTVLTGKPLYIGATEPSKGIGEWYNGSMVYQAKIEQQNGQSSMYKLYYHYGFPLPSQLNSVLKIGGFVDLNEDKAFKPADDTVYGWSEKEITFDTSKLAYGEDIECPAVIFSDNGTTVAYGSISGKILISDDLKKWKSIVILFNKEPVENTDPIGAWQYSDLVKDPSTGIYKISNLPEGNYWLYVIVDVGNTGNMQGAYASQYAKNPVTIDTDNPSLKDLTGVDIYVGLDDPALGSISGTIHVGEDIAELPISLCVFDQMPGEGTSPKACILAVIDKTTKTGKFLIGNLMTATYYLIAIVDKDPPGFGDEDMMTLVPGTFEIDILVPAKKDIKDVEIWINVQDPSSGSISGKVTFLEQPDKSIFIGASIQMPQPNMLPDVFTMIQPETGKLVYEYTLMNVKKGSYYVFAGLEEDNGKFGLYPGKVEIDPDDVNKKNVKGVDITVK